MGRKINDKILYWIENYGVRGKRLSERDYIWFGTNYNHYKYRGYTLLKNYKDRNELHLCKPSFYASSQTTCNRMNAFIDFYGYSDGLVYKSGMFYLKVLRDSYSCKGKKVIDFFPLFTINDDISLSKTERKINDVTIEEWNKKALKYFEGVKEKKQKQRKEKRRINKNEI